MKNAILFSSIILLSVSNVVSQGKTYVPDNIFENFLESNGIGEGVSFSSNYNPGLNISCTYGSCENLMPLEVCSSNPAYIVSIDVSVLDDYSGSVSLSLLNQPAGMSISSLSNEIGPSFPTTGNHMYVSLDDTFIMGTYTFDLVLTRSDGSSNSLTLTRTFELVSTTCSDPLACNYEPSFCSSFENCTYPATGYNCAGESYLNISCTYGSCENLMPLEVCSSYPAYIVSIDVSVLDDYSGSVSLSLLNQPAGMSISSLSNEIGPSFPTTGNHMYVSLDDTFIMGTYTFDLVLTRSDGSSNSLTLTRTFELVSTTCSDPSACNYEPSSCSSFENCTYPSNGYSCEEIFDSSGNCIVDLDSNGVCDHMEIRGCTYPDAENYSMSATQDDGSCIYAETIAQCTGDLDNDGSIGTNDLLVFLSLFATTCD